MAIATAEAHTPNVFAVSAIEISISRPKKQAISVRTLGRIRGFAFTAFPAFTFHFFRNPPFLPLGARHTEPRIEHGA